MRTGITSLFLLTLFIASCDKKPVPDTGNTVKSGAVNIEIDNVAGDDKLSLNDAWYATPNGDSLNISIYAYYISNIKLTTADGKQFAEQESYHLVDEARPATKKFTISDVPEGTYTSISFIIGVDSARNVSGAQTGDLAVEHGMFWDWNTGYIMAKVEGIISQVKADNELLYHMGGFSGEYSVLRTVTMQLPQSLKVSEQAQPVIHFKNNALEWFQTPYTIDVKAMRFPGNRENNVKIADNYSDMFSIEHIDQ